MFAQSSLAFGLNCRRLYPISIWLCLSLIFLSGGGALAGTCPADEAVRAALDKGADLPGPNAQANFSTAFLPGGATATLLIDAPYRPDTDLRVFLRTAAGSALEPSAAATGLPERTGVTFAVPSADLSDFWHTARVITVACRGLGDTAKLLYVARARAPISPFGLAVVLTLLLVGLVYGLTVLKVRHYRQKNPGMIEPCENILKCWDPVYLTANGATGHGSLSRLQIFFFTVLIFGLMTHILLRTGVLAGLSQDVLLLLGISGAGATATGVTENTRRRLTCDNWAWLRLHGWLAQEDKRQTPAWSDLVIVDGYFNVYQFQMLAFSLIVGGALLTAGLTGLSEFAIPDEVLGILGLSQVIYVGGKVVAPPVLEDLDKKITELQKLEKDFIEQAAQAGLERDPHDPEPDLETATRLAHQAYQAYLREAEKTVVTLESTIPNTPAVKSLEPRLPWLKSLFQRRG